MANDMNQMRATANEHMRRDVEAGWKWVCQCEDCQQIRSLIGMDKTLEVRPLIRKIEQLEDQLKTLPDGPALRALKEQYLQLHDELAAVMAK